MGLPIDQLVIATNSNDILHRCLSDNDHRKHSLKHTLSPSMDIMVSSNFERLLFDLYDRDGAAIRSEEHTSELQSRGPIVCRFLLDTNKNVSTWDNLCEETMSS